MTAAGPRDDNDDNNLSSRLGYRFIDPGLLERALTHSSASTPSQPSNERMEFLGDRVLGLVLARMLFDAFRNEAEGQLGYRFTALAQRGALARVAEELDLAPHIMLSEGEATSGGRENPAILADTMEAVIAAVYLDGGLTPAEDLVRRFWRPMMDADHAPPKDAKTLLQEWAQGRGLDLPNYTETARTGPDHAPIFTIEVAVAGYPPAVGEGASKRGAEQAAAEALLDLLEVER